MQKFSICMSDSAIGSRAAGVMFAFLGCNDQAHCILLRKGQVPLVARRDKTFASPKTKMFALGAIAVMTSISICMQACPVCMQFKGMFAPCRKGARSSWKHHVAENREENTGTSLGSLPSFSQLVCDQFWVQKSEEVAACALGPNVAGQPGAI